MSLGWLGNTTVSSQKLEVVSGEGGVAIQNFVFLSHNKMPPAPPRYVQGVFLCQCFDSVVTAEEIRETADGKSHTHGRSSYPFVSCVFCTLL